MRSKPHDQAMAELLRNDPAYAMQLVDALLADGEQGELQIMLRQLVLAYGGVPAVAAQAQLDAAQLQRMLTAHATPAAPGLRAMLAAIVGERSV